MLSKAKYAFYTLNLSFTYHRYIKDFEKHRLFAGVGIEVNPFIYKNTIKLNLEGGEQNIVKTGRRLTSGSFQPNIPVLLAKVVTEFDLSKIKNIRASLVLKKDFNYFLESAIPMFSAISVGLDIPIF